jgi:type IV pilus biogenesis protein PilP
MANKYSSLIAFIGLSVSAFSIQSFAQSPAPLAAPSAPKTVQVDVLSLKQARSKAVVDAQKNIENLHAIKSKIAVEEARSKLAALERETVGSKSEGMQPVKTLPKVVSVFGQIDDFSAQIVFAGGTTRNIKTGQKIGGMRVAAITLEEVLLKDANGIEVSLPFATHLSAEEAIKESLSPSFTDTSGSSAGFAVPQKMPTFAGPLPLAKP